MKTLKLNHRVKATYKARKNAKNNVYSIITVKAHKYWSPYPYSYGILTTSFPLIIAAAIERAAILLGLTQKPVQWQIIDINGTPAHLVNLK